MSNTTKIAGRDVPIEPGVSITIRFSGGRAGKSEGGLYEFWTVYKKRNGIIDKYTARCLQASDPGERFRRKEGQEEYEACWKVATTAKGIRPATQKEVIKWLNEHKEDAPFAESCQVEGKTMNPVGTPDGFQFE